MLLRSYNLNSALKGSQFFQPQPTHNQPNAFLLESMNNLKMGEGEEQEMKRKKKICLEISSAKMITYLLCNQGQFNL